MFKKLTAALVAVFLSTQLVAAASGPEKESAAIAMVDRAVALFESDGMDAMVAATLDQSNTDFFNGEMYVIAFDFDGNCVVHGANPKLVGKNLSAVKDPTGQAIVEVLEAGVTGQEAGWVEYQWTNPTTQKVAAKRTYVRDLGNGHYIGVGFYK